MLTVHAKAETSATGISSRIGWSKGFDDLDFVWDMEKKNINVTGQQVVYGSNWLFKISWI